MEEAEEALREIERREAAKESLLAFVEYTHPKWVCSAYHKTICEHLEALERGDIRKLIINAPRRHSKSELASRRFPSWAIGRHPDWQVGLASYGDTIAEDLSRNVRNILRDQYFRNVFTGVDLSTDTTAAGRWETTAGGIFTAAGIGGPLTGRGMDLGIIDDPHKDRQEADSPRIREIVWQWYMAVFVGCLQPGARQLVMATRWHEDDIVGRLLNMEREDWSYLNLQAISGEGTDHEAALSEERFPLAEMRKKRETLRRGGRSREWNSQYMGNPTPEEGTYIQRKWIEKRWTGKAPSPMHVYMAADFAVTDAMDARDPDWSVIGVFGVDADSNLLVLDWWRGKTSPDVWFDVLIDLVNRWKPLDVCAAKGIIRRAVERPLLARCNERRVWFNTVWMDEVMDKKVKGRAFQARASMGKVLFPEYPWASEVVEQIVGFPTIKHDDDFDVLSLMCLHLDEAPAPVRVVEAETETHDRWQTMSSSHGAERWKTL